MMLLTCPYCGPRAEIEFTCGGESHVSRPAPPGSADDAIWTDYLFQRRNTKGVGYERWLHAAGCRQWFNVARDSVTHRIVATYRMGEPRPGPEAA